MEGNALFNIIIACNLLIILFLYEQVKDVLKEAHVETKVLNMMATLTTEINRKNETSLGNTAPFHTILQVCPQREIILLWAKILIRREIIFVTLSVRPNADKETVQIAEKLTQSLREGGIKAQILFHD